MEEDGINPLVTNYPERNDPTFLPLPDYKYYSQRWEKTRDEQCGNENLGHKILK